MNSFRIRYFLFYLMNLNDLSLMVFNLKVHKGQISFWKWEEKGYFPDMFRCLDV